MARPRPERPRGPSLVGLLAPYRGWIILLVVLTLLASGLGLLVPQIIAHAIDAFTAGRLDLTSSLASLTVLTLGVFVLGALQTAVQTYASERVARDLRARLAHAISGQTYAAIEALTPATLLTNFTSDVDAIKMFVATALASLISSLFLILGASALLLWINWRLALAVLLVVPIIALTFFVVLARVRKLFGEVQAAVDALNKVLNENIVGAALVRLLDAQRSEFAKFLEVNGRARAIGLKILRQFASMIPIIVFMANAATLTILVLGGRFVIDGQMTLGQFSAFNAYLGILIFPIMIIGFMSNAIGQAQASYLRISRVLEATAPPPGGEEAGEFSGDIELRAVTLAFGERKVLDNVSFRIGPGARVAVIGPTAAGKTQLLYVMAGLIAPTAGAVFYDGRPIEDYNRESFYAQVGFVFQDSALFNLTLRENIGFGATVDEDRLAKAIETAELQEFIGALPQGLDTVVSERGASLSGGQKQRVMLARALAIEPRILFLDDFTARVDSVTESRILANVARNYPDLTLVSITQKIAPVEDYEQIILLMEGEVLATGTHQELVRSSPEYVQILQSQQSTDHYEAA